jgi:hypothetical protein
VGITTAETASFPAFSPSQYDGLAAVPAKNNKKSRTPHARLTKTRGCLLRSYRTLHVDHRTIRRLKGEMRRTV